MIGKWEAQQGFQTRNQSQRGTFISLEEKKKIMTLTLTSIGKMV